jgi:hypothetical protein
MSCFLTTSQGDLDISTGNLVITNDIPTCVAQDLNSKFKFFQGDWFADKRLGVPYYQYVFVKNPNMGIVRQVLLSVIKSNPDVTTIVSADLQYFSTQRSATAKFVLKTTGGVQLTGGPGAPFVISGIGASPP